MSVPKSKKKRSFLFFFFFKKRLENLRLEQGRTGWGAEKLCCVHSWSRNLPQLEVNSTKRVHSKVGLRFMDVHFLASVKIVPCWDHFSLSNKKKNLRVERVYGSRPLPNREVSLIVSPASANTYSKSSLLGEETICPSYFGDLFTGRFIQKLNWNLPFINTYPLF